MLDLTIFRNRLFAAATAAAFINGLARFALMFLFVFYFQGAQGDDPITAGIKLIPLALGMLRRLSAGRHLRRPPRLARAGRAGHGGQRASAWRLMTTLQVHSPYWQSTLWLLIVGVGSGMFNSPNTAAMMGTVRRHSAAASPPARARCCRTPARCFRSPSCWPSSPRPSPRRRCSGSSPAWPRACPTQKLAPFIANMHIALWVLAATSLVGRGRLPAAPPARRAPDAPSRRPARATGRRGRREALVRAGPDPMSEDRRSLRIGDVARLVGHDAAHDPLLRGDRPAARGGAAPRPGSHRLYSDADVERLREVMRLRDLLGVSLDELKTLVAAEQARAALRDRAPPRATSSPARRARAAGRGAGPHRAPARAGAPPRRPSWPSSTPSSRTSASASGGACASWPPRPAPPIPVRAGSRRGGPALTEAPRAERERAGSASRRAGRRPRRALRRLHRGGRRLLRGRARRGVRPARPQRRRQDHDAARADHAPRSPTKAARCVAGYDVRRERLAVRSSIGYVPQAISVDGALTARENLEFYARVTGVPGRERAERIEEADRGDGAGAVARPPRAHPVRRHAAPPGDRHRPAQPSAGAVPRRADGRASTRPPGAWCGTAWMPCGRSRARRTLVTTHMMEEAERHCDRARPSWTAAVSSRRATRPSLRERHEADSLEEVFTAVTGHGIEDRGREVRRCPRPAQRGPPPRLTTALRWPAARSRASGRRHLCHGAGRDAQAAPRPPRRLHPLGPAAAVAVHLRHRPAPQPLADGGLAATTGPTSRLG